jgi:two-component system sensor histidine kinase/response regulator
MAKKEKAKMDQVTTRPRALVVDDEELNVKLMEKILVSAGYSVAHAKNGRDALNLIGTFRPDVVLLDVMMPEMNGFEACKRIKSDPAFLHIPVVMVTSLTDRQSRIGSLEAGADDFVSKPVDAQEIVARCRNLVKMKFFMDEIARKNGELEKLHQLKKDLTDMIVHDLRTPLTSILGNIELAMIKHPESEDIQRNLSYAKHSCDSLVTMMNDLLDISRIEEGKMQLDMVAIDVAVLLQKVVETFLPIVRQEAKKLIIDPVADFKVMADAGLLERILQNLVSNAMKYITKETGEVRVSVIVAEGRAVFAVADNGEGIPAAYHSRIFEKFTRAQDDAVRMKTSKGLGLTFCKMAVEAHKGTIWVESEPGNGSRFMFTMPLEKKD